MRLKILVAMALALLPASLVAAPSFNAQNLKPASENGLYLGVYGSQTLPPGKFTLGISGDWSEEPVILVNPAGAKIQEIIHREINTHFTGAVGILPWFDVGVLVSAAPYIRFQGIGAASPETHTEMGDIRLNTRFRILDNRSFPLGLAVVPFVTFPTGDEGTFTGNGGVTGGGHLVVESKRFLDRFSTAFNVGAEIREQAVLSSGTTMDDLLHYGAALNFAADPAVDLIIEMRGFTLFSDFFGAGQRPIEMEGAVRFYPHKHIAATVAGGAGVLEGVGNPLWRGMVSVAYIPEHKGFERKQEIFLDTDGDGIRDSKDRCPTEAGPRTNGGCPEKRKIEISPEEFRILARPIHFDFAKATLRPDALPILETLAEALKAKPSIKRLSIEGHCDFIGPDYFNDWLSVERAKAVQKYLVEHGIEAERLSVIGFGEKRPVDPGTTREARAKNRRVEFVFKEVVGMKLPETIPASPTPTLPETNPEANPDLTTPQPDHH